MLRRSSLLRAIEIRRWHRTVSTQVTPDGIANPVRYCREYVKKHDYDSYLCSYFYPRQAQDGYFAIKALNVELAMIPDSVSNPAIGQMRMQFWKDAIKAIPNNHPPKHPIALALHQTWTHTPLPAYHFSRLIEARAQELHEPSHLTVNSMTAHAESTSSTLLYLLLSLLGLSSSSLYSHAASHVGVATSLTTLLRAMPFHASKGRMVLPADIAARHGLLSEEVFRMGGDARALDDAVFEFATLANDHLITARELFTGTSNGTVPPAAMPVFLTAIPAATYLQRLEKFNFNPFEAKLQPRDWKLAWSIWRAYHRRLF